MSQTIVPNVLPQLFTPQKRKMHGVCSGSIELQEKEGDIAHNLEIQDAPKSLNMSSRLQSTNISTTPRFQAKQVKSLREKEQEQQLSESQSFQQQSENSDKITVQNEDNMEQQNSGQIHDDFDKSQKLDQVLNNEIEHFDNSQIDQHQQEQQQLLQQQLDNQLQIQKQQQILQEKLEKEKQLLEEKRKLANEQQKIKQAILENENQLREELRKQQVISDQKKQQLLKLQQQQESMKKQQLQLEKEQLQQSQVQSQTILDQSQDDIVIELQVNENVEIKKCIIPDIQPKEVAVDLDINFMNKKDIQLHLLQQQQQLINLKQLSRYDKNAERQKAILKFQQKVDADKKAQQLYVQSIQQNIEERQLRKKEEHEKQIQAQIEEKQRFEEFYKQKQSEIQKKESPKRVVSQQQVSKPVLPQIQRQIHSKLQKKHHTQSNQTTNNFMNAIKQAHNQVVCQMSLVSPKAMMLQQIVPEEDLYKQKADQMKFLNAQNQLIHQLQLDIEFLEKVKFNENKKGSAKTNNLQEAIQINNKYIQEVKRSDSIDQLKKIKQKFTDLLIQIDIDIKCK